MIQQPKKNLCMCNEEAWPPEPTNIDDTWAKYDEPMIYWLERSTLPRAKMARRFLRENLAKLSSEDRKHFISALKTKWNSTFLELIVARTIQELGGNFLIEPKRPGDNRLDFLVDFDNSQLMIEVVSPDFDIEEENTRRKDAKLLNFINENAPEGWSIIVIQLPEIGFEDSQKMFKEAFLRVCSKLPQEPQEEWYDINESVKSKGLQAGKLHLKFFPKKLGHEPIVSSELYFFGTDVSQPFGEDAKERIRKAVKKKRKQVGDDPLPVLLAVHGSGYGVTFDDFDRALFGEKYTTLEDNRRTRRTKFKANGIFLEPGKDNKDPTYAGVIAFRRIDFTRKSDPVIYLHPRFSGTLPAQLMGFEQRRFQKPDKVDIQPPKIHDVIARIYSIDQKS